MTPEALDALVASGATVEMIAAAWKAEMAAAPKRSTSAARMARKRARDAGPEQPVTTGECDACDVTTVTVTHPPSPPLLPPKPPINPTPAPVDKNTRARGTRLAADFELPDDWRDWAVKERGWDRRAAEDEGRAFADFWHGKPGRDGTKADWPATWRNWVRNSRRNNGAAPARAREAAYAHPLC